MTCTHITACKAGQGSLKRQCNMLGFCIRRGRAHSAAAQMRLAPGLQRAVPLLPSPRLALGHTGTALRHCLEVGIRGLVTPLPSEPFRQPRADRHQMPALTVCVARPAGRPSAAPASQPSTHAPRPVAARALSIPAPQPALGASSYTAGPTGAQLEAAGPSCPWPQHQPAAAQGRGIFAWLQVRMERRAAEQAHPLQHLAAGPCDRPRARRFVITAACILQQPSTPSAQSQARMLTARSRCSPSPCRAASSSRRRWKRHCRPRSSA